MYECVHVDARKLPSPYLPIYPSNHCMFVHITHLSTILPSLGTEYQGFELLHPERKYKPTTATTT